MEPETENNLSDRPNCPTCPTATGLCADESCDSTSPLLPLPIPASKTGASTSEADTSTTTAAELLSKTKPLPTVTPKHTTGAAVAPLPTGCRDGKQDYFGSTCSNWSQHTSSASIKVSYDLTPFSSTQSSLYPLCRICQLPNEKNNILISPCRCDGSVKHVHGTCLRKWIETKARRRKTEGSARCELCGYIYRKHKYLKCTEWRWPKVKTRDKILHSIFLLSLVIMVVCAAITIRCLISDSGQSAANKYRLPDDTKPYLTAAELITLICGILFFVTFILAMIVEIKARHTIYNMFRRFIRYNTVWIIENYKPELDRPSTLKTDLSSKN